MPNQLNYPDPLLGTLHQRPIRISNSDLELIGNDTKQILFGTNAKDHVEAWVYNIDGTIAGHINLPATDEQLGLATVIDQTGTSEVLTCNLVDAFNRMNVQPGRYALVLNFFRDEVGSEDGYKLFISDISSDRMELRLHPVAFTPEVAKDLYEFASPSVPKIFANGLIDQLFRKTANFNQERITTDELKKYLEALMKQTLSKVQYANLEASLENTLDLVLRKAYPKVIKAMVEDVRNEYVQREEIETYILDAVELAVSELSMSGELDPHFELV